jgi:hypothetical protein
MAKLGGGGATVQGEGTRMMKHVAAAVLYAAVSLMGSLAFGAGTSALDPDGTDDDAGVECVEYVREPGKPGGGGAGGPLLLSVASRLCGEEIDGAWVVRDASGPAAAVTVHHLSEDVAVVDVAGTLRARELDLLAHALDKCRESEALKVVVSAKGLDRTMARAMAESRGYVFSRERFADGAPRLEFYTDLYWRERSS